MARVGRKKQLRVKLVDDWKPTPEDVPLKKGHVFTVRRKMLNRGVECYSVKESGWLIPIDVTEKYLGL